MTAWCKVKTERQEGEGKAMFDCRRFYGQSQTKILEISAGQAASPLEAVRSSHCGMSQLPPTQIAASGVSQLRPLSWATGLCPPRVKNFAREVI